LGVITVVIEQHAEDLAFQWMLRDQAVLSPHYALTDVVDLDAKIEAHIDGLRVAGNPGWEICKGKLSWKEPGEVFAAAQLAFESADDGRIEEVLDAGTGSVELSRGIVSALGWLALDDALPHIERLGKSDSPIKRRISIGADALHRRDPGKRLNEGLVSEEGPLRARALKALGESGRPDLLPSCKAAFGAEGEDTRFWAAWSAALLGDPESVDVLQGIAASGTPCANRACDLAVRRMPLPKALAWQKELVAGEDSRRLAVNAAGALGDPVLVPWLIDVMSTDELARPAGEAFSFITGIDLADEDLEGEWPEGFEAGPTESPDDEDVAMDPDEDLPWPDPDLIMKWWSENQSRFVAGTRYLLGQPIGPESLAKVLRVGKQRQRAAAALELALRIPEEPLFEVRARGDRQRQLLGV
jgi:uncharacterized protein (TIGR02270 family)